MKLFLVADGDVYYLVVAEDREKALDAMTGYGSTHIRCREVPANVKLPIVARVLQYARG